MRWVHAMLVGALTVGCGEVTVVQLPEGHAPQGEAGCVWQAQQPRAIAARETRALELMVSRDGSRVSLAHVDAEGAWVTRWSWGDAVGVSRRVSQRNALLLGGGPADEMTAIAIGDEGDVVLIEESGAATPLGWRLEDGAGYRTLGPPDRDGVRTFMFSSLEGDATNAIRFDGSEMSSHTLGCGGRAMDLWIGDSPLAVVEAWAPLGACSDWDRDQMFEVVSLTDGRDVRHVVPRPDVQYPRLGAARIVEHADGLSLFWNEIETCGVYCFGGSVAHASWLQPLDRQGVAVGPPRQLSMGDGEASLRANHWPGAITAMGDGVAILDRGSPDRIQFIDRLGDVGQSVPTAGGYGDMDHGQPSLVSIAGRPSSPDEADTLVAAWTRGAGEVVVQAFVCTR